jgi:phosphatidylserine decarboxylase
LGLATDAMQPKWYKLKSRRKGDKKNSEVSGEVQIQFSLVDAANPAASPEEIYLKFRSTILAADAESEGGRSRLPSHDTNADDDTDAELDDEDGVDETGKDEETSDETEDQTKPDSEKKKKKRKLKMLRRKSRAIRSYEFTGKDSDVSGIIFLAIGKITDLPPEKNSKYLKSVKYRTRAKTTSVTRTSFDMDPFVVTSLGRKVMRTKVVRHNLNPVYNEKMVLQVMRLETAYSIYFTVMDRDTLSGNDFIASTNYPVQRLVAAAPEADPNTGLYKLQEPVESSQPPPNSSKSRFRLPISRSTSSSSLSKLTRPPLKSDSSQNSLSSLSQLDARDPQTASLAPTSAPSDQSVVNRVNSNGEGEAAQQSPEDPDMQPLVIPLTLKNKERWEDKHSPELYITAKYLPYRALRQQFWRAMLKQYDADESGRVSKIELTTMLDTLGSTLKESTIDGFFHRFAQENESADSLDLTFDQAVICLEEQLLKSTRRATLRQKIKGLGHHAREGTLANGEQQNGAKTQAEGNKHDSTNAESDRTAVPVMEQDAIGASGEEGSLLNEDDLAEEGGEEHVIEIRECPLCHQPRMGKRTDADIITHIATCASSDWRQVNNLVMGGFVTSSQAQRKWYSKVITKISYGGYKLGANSANILVQDRITGQINEERMSVYVRLGIRLLYKALGSREMEKKRSGSLSLYSSKSVADKPKSEKCSDPSALSRARSTTTQLRPVRSKVSSLSTSLICPRCCFQWNSSGTLTNSSTVL